MPRRQLLLVVVVVGVAAGPLDPGSGLTGTLHYTSDSDRLPPVSSTCSALLNDRSLSSSFGSIDATIAHLRH